MSFPEKQHNRNRTLGDIPCCQHRWSRYEVGMGAEQRLGNLKSWFDCTLPAVQRPAQPWQAVGMPHYFLFAWQVTHCILILLYQSRHDVFNDFFFLILLLVFFFNSWNICLHLFLLSLTLGVSWTISLPRDWWFFLLRTFTVFWRRTSGCSLLLATCLGRQHPERRVGSICNSEWREEKI